MELKNLGIIGFGRFGKVLHRLFQGGFEIAVSSSSYRDGDLPNIRFRSLEETVRCSNAILLAVPIRKIGETAARIRPFLSSGQLVVDVCSVKETPFREISAALIGSGAHIWPTHPMFGPDSTRDGFNGLVWVSCEETVDPAVIAPYTAYLESRGLSVFRTTCEEHDRTAAATQGLTHLIGRYLYELNLTSTPIDTLGYKRLLAVRDQTCNDSWELFSDLMRRNRFTQDIQDALARSMRHVSDRLREDRVAESDDRDAGGGSETQQSPGGNHPG